MSKMWMVRSGRGGRFGEERVDRNRVALGWGNSIDPARMKTKQDVIAAIAADFPEYTGGQVDSAASQIWRFIKDVQLNDQVATYDPQTRLYHVGIIASNAKYDPASEDDGAIYREVKWQRTTERDSLAADARNSLGSVLTLFSVDPSHAAQLSGEAPVPSSPPTTLGDPASEDREAFEDLENRSIERIKDRINRLEWDAMQELVASLLRAMGYKTIVSPGGPDRGKDIIASPDGFGFEQPRIVVEVKHRRGQMGAQEIRSFLGGRHPEDRGLYVSTGGFSKDASYEAERASTVTHLMTLDGLARAIVDHYDNLDAKGRSLVHLTRVYWPV